MEFGRALRVLKNGGKVIRDVWERNGSFICFAPDTSLSANFGSRLWVQHPDGRRVLWALGQSDVLAEDWVEVL